jgi:hypothetical protein
MTYTYKLSRRLAVIFGVGALAVLLLALGFLLGSSAHTTYHLMGEWLAALLQSRIVTRLFYLIIVGIGCAAGRVFPFQREFQGSRDFLKHMFPGRTALFYERTDFFLTCILGSILGMLIVQPTTVHTALATGLGWPFIVRVLVEGMKTGGQPVGRSGGRGARTLKSQSRDRPAE